MRKSVIITGGSGGIGIECVQKFAEAAYAVFSVDLGSSRYLLDTVTSSGGAHFTADATDFQRAEGICREVKGLTGGITALVTCAGAADNKNILDIEPETWQKIIDINLTGTFNYIRAAAPFMKEQENGVIITIASTTAFRARRNLPAYIASKSGIIGLTKAVARDLGCYGINVNCVAPGLVETKMTEVIPEKIKEKLRQEACLGHISTPEQVADVIVMFASDNARQITGEVIRVDGGQLS